MDLVELLKRPESKTLEFKRDLSSPEGALKTIVAFANTAGGALLDRLRGALARLNPALPAEALDDAFRKLTRPEGAELVARSWWCAAARCIGCWWHLPYI